MGSRKLRQKLGPRYERYIESKPVLWLLSMFHWPRRKIRQLYGWVISWAEKKSAERALAGLSFAESSFFPIPPDPLLIATTIAKPNKYLRLALITTIASVVGGLFGYFIGAVLFETMGRWVIDTYHLQSDFDSLSANYQENAGLAVFAAALTPIPYKIITISAGVFHINLIAFIVASIIGRGARFFAVATLMHHFGKRYKDKIEKYIDVLSLAFVALIILGILALKLL